MVGAGTALSEQNSKTFELILAYLSWSVDDSPLNDLRARRGGEGALVGPKIHGADGVVDLLPSDILVDVAVAVPALGDLLPLPEEDLHPGVVKVSVGAKQEGDGNDIVEPILGVEDSVLSLELLPANGVLGGDHQFDVIDILQGDASGDAAGQVNARKGIFVNMLFEIDPEAERVDGILDGAGSVVEVDVAGEGVDVMRLLANVVGKGEVDGALRVAVAHVGAGAGSVELLPLVIGSVQISPSNWTAVHIAEVVVVIYKTCPLVGIGQPSRNGRCRHGGIHVVRIGAVIDGTLVVEAAAASGNFGVRNFALEAHEVTIAVGIGVAVAATLSAGRGGGAVVPGPPVLESVVVTRIVANVDGALQKVSAETSRHVLVRHVPGPALEVAGAVEVGVALAAALGAGSRAGTSVVGEIDLVLGLGWGEVAKVFAIPQHLPAVAAGDGRQLVVPLEALHVAGAVPVGIAVAL